MVEEDIASRKRHWGNRRTALTTKQEPECPPSYLTLNRVEAVVRCFFVHPKGNGDMCRLSEGCMLGGIVSFAEVVDTVAVW
jgi:hypothetical protein